MTNATYWCNNVNNRLWWCIVFQNFFNIFWFTLLCECFNSTAEPREKIYCLTVALPNLKRLWFSHLSPLNSEFMDLFSLFSAFQILGSQFVKLLRYLLNFRRVMWKLHSLQQRRNSEHSVWCYWDLVWKFGEDKYETPGDFSLVKIWAQYMMLLRSLQ